MNKTRAFISAPLAIGLLVFVVMNMPHLIGVFTLTAVSAATLVAFCCFCQLHRLQKSDSPFIQTLTSVQIMPGLARAFWQEIYTGVSALVVFWFITMPEAGFVVAHYCCLNLFYIMSKLDLIAGKEKLS